MLIQLREIIDLLSMKNILLYRRKLNMKEFIKYGIGIYIGYSIMQVIDKGLGLSDKATNFISKVKITEETK